MKSSRWLWLAVVSVGTACNIYNDALLEQATGDPDATGGIGSGGDGSDTGGTASGAAPNTGGNSTDGGTGGENMGGDTGDGGTGGASGGNSNGGSGGDVGAGGGSGGSGGSVPAIGLVDDFTRGTPASASYNHMPFYGTWARYQQTGAVWAAASVSAMMQADPDDAGNGVLHVEATMLNDWGIGIFVTLKNGGPIDLSDATGISFSVMSMNGETTLRVALADVNSHRNACVNVNGGVDCDKHMRTVEAFAMGPTWTEVDLPLDSFVDKEVDAIPRSADLDLTAIYSVHFQLDPELVGAAADFYLDDLTVY